MYCHSGEADKYDQVRSLSQLFTSSISNTHKAQPCSDYVINNYQSKISQAYLEVHRELRRLDNLQGIFDLKRKESGILLAAVDVSRELFRYGRTDYLEVLLARQNALRVNMELIEARRMQFLTAVRLYRALGGD